jgi:hypothetical protein
MFNQIITNAISKAKARNGNKRKINTSSIDQGVGGWAILEWILER